MLVFHRRFIVNGSINANIARKEFSISKLMKKSLIISNFRSLFKAVYQMFYINTDRVFDEGPFLESRERVQLVFQIQSN